MLLMSGKLFTAKVEGWLFCWHTNRKSFIFIAITSSWLVALHICWSCSRSHLRFACWLSPLNTMARSIPFDDACSNIDTSWRGCRRWISTCKWWECSGWCWARVCCSILCSDRLQWNRHVPALGSTSWQPSPLSRNSSYRRSYTADRSSCQQSSRSRICQNREFLTLKSASSNRS